MGLCDRPIAGTGTHRNPRIAHGGSAHVSPGQEFAIRALLVVIAPIRNGQFTLAKMSPHPTAGAEHVR